MDGFIGLSFIGKIQFIILMVIKINYLDKKNTNKAREGVNKICLPKREAFIKGIQTYERRSYAGRNADLF